MKKHIVTLFLCFLALQSGCAKKEKNLMQKAQEIIDNRIEAKLGGFKAKDLMQYDDIAGDLLEVIDDLFGGGDYGKSHRS